MQSTSANNKRIAKNTMFLYIRMGVSMLVGLYTSRIVLNALGVENYGIYNIVGSFIVAFTFISGPLGTATQRFLNFELGKGPDGRLNKVFNLSFYTYVVLSILLLCVIEIAGIWFLNHKMQMPVERRDAAFFAFHMSVLTLLLNLLKTPFESLIIAYERMSFYAYISIADVLLKLINAFLLLYVSLDKLKIFAANILVISAIVICVTVVYCRRNFKNVKIQVPRKNWDLPLFKELVGFSGWSLFGSVASMSANQGLNLLLNMFFGVVVNAAMGIANQVNTAVVQFVSNFQVAFRPQLVKYYAQGNISALQALIINTSKYSYLLLFAIACPICFNIHAILNLWLGTPPDYAAEFCIMMLIYALLETLSAPMWMTVQATGKIKKYQIVISACISLNFFLSYCLLRKGFPPISVLVVKCVLDVACLEIRMFFLKKMIGFSPLNYLKVVIFPLLVISVLSVLSFILVENDGVINCAVRIVVFYVVFFSLTFLFVFDSNEKHKILSFVQAKVGSRK